LSCAIFEAKFTGIPTIYLVPTDRLKISSSPHPDLH